MRVKSTHPIGQLVPSDKIGSHYCHQHLQYKGTTVLNGLISQMSLMASMSSVDIIKTGEEVACDTASLFGVIAPCTWKGQKDVAMVEERCRLDQVMRR